MDVIIELIFEILSQLFDIGGGTRRARRKRSNPVRVRILLGMLIGFILLCAICVVIGALAPGNH